MTSSKQRNLAAFAFGLGECLLFGGLKYGWASLVFVLKDLGYFHGCSNNLSKDTYDTSLSGTDINNSTWTYGHAGNATQHDLCDKELRGLCRTQDSCLHLVFTIATVTCGMMAIPTGALVDRCSIRIPRLIFSVVICSGLLMLALSTPDTSQLLYPSIAGITMGGIVIGIANMQIGNLFISKRSTVVTVYNGAIDSSAIILLTVKVAYEHGISLQISCFTLFAVAFVLFVINTLLLPRDRIVWPPTSKTKARCDDEHKGKANGISSGSKLYTEVKGNDRSKRTRRQSIQLCEAHKEMMEYPNMTSAFVSPMFAFFLLWVSVLQLRDLYFLGTFHSWITELVGDDHSTVSHFTSIMTMVQCAGVVISPLPGLLLDRNKRKVIDAEKALYQDLKDSILVYVITTAVSVLFSISVILPVIQLQYVSFVLQVVLRAFLYGIASAFLPMAFPTRYYATMLGVLFAAAGLFSLLQYPIFLLVQGPLQGNHYYVNVAFIAMCLSTMLFPIYIHIYVKKKEKLLELNRSSKEWIKFESDLLTDEDKTRSDKV
ncbi:equilibrative nucleobase transporter 1-like [Amphiura filiformis]|uniref:equilibrative nucleobase transporter 1-like n=1 Tax=Amphiura filiformis TaxID=82378 RepID=UPI003B214C2F